MASPSSRDGSLPVPISLTIYNRLPPHTEETASTATATATVTSNKKWFRPDYTVGLLVSVRLEIVVKDEEEDEEHTVYSSTIDSDQSTIHPVWDHLNERVPFNPEGWEVYSKSTFARIILPNNNTILVDYVPLHPNSLRRLPKDDCNDSYTNSTPSPPSSLPPNAVLIHYSDGLVRVESALYHALLKQHVIEEANPRDFSLIQDDDEENKQRSRFEDNVFDILGKVENTITPSVSVITSSSLLETDNEALATPIRTVQEGDFDDEDSLTTSRIPTTEGEARLQDLQSDHDTLLAQLEAEELLLKAEEEALNSQAKYLQSTVQIVSDLEEETTQIRRATTQILSDEQDVNFAITVYQKRLVKELQQIYPITCKNQDRYWIASAELPLDLFRGQVHEDEISAALGFLAHALVLLSKYLNIPVRHRIVCNSSRSAIQDADGTILPLFLSRVAERQQLERGLSLLYRNVGCLAQSQGLIITEEQHILAKLRHVYDKVVCG